MSTRKKGLVLFLVFLLLTAGIFPAFANQIDEKKGELGAVKEDLKSVQDELKGSKAKESTIQRDIRLLENDIYRVQAEIRALGQKVSTTENEIAEAEAELADAEERIGEMDKLLAVRLRAIYENGQVSYLDVLFASASFTEFLTRYNDLQLIIAEDRELLIRFQGEREQILAMKNRLEDRRQDLLGMRRDSLAKKQELEGKTKERARLLVAVRNEIDAQEDAIKKLEAEAKKIEAIIKALQAAQKTGYRGTGQYNWPVPDYGPSWITSGYGYRVHPITRRPGTFHGGIDIGIPHVNWAGSRSFSGNPAEVVAADTGTAHVYRMGSGYGNLIIIDHGGGIATVYAHLHRFLIADKQEVVRGQAIAHVGSTGASTGPHLHFEVRINGERKNPLDYVR
ncbi:MAG: peptidoglycan DD-metalloendopeptidase family protein [Clostridiales bacterium]|jgi:murein DD-endopeptidase MepM/ murein hydrolase activator NlpD|nr:peptidoglycan DD-metalloendopeptidase family protein [Clostridiales bacterium]